MCWSQSSLKWSLVLFSFLSVWKTEAQKKKNNFSSSTRLKQMPANCFVCLATLHLEGQSDTPSSTRHATKAIESLFIKELNGMWIRQNTSYNNKS